MQLKQAYEPRQIQFLELFEAQDWRLKVYSILYGDKTVDQDLMTAAKKTALNFLPQPATTPNYYGVGFVSVHQGKSYDFVTVAYWTYDTELRHQTYMRPSSSSSTLEPLTGELSLDVWDLRLLAFERTAWVETILQTESPTLDAYLARQLVENA